MKIYYKLYTYFNETGLEEDGLLAIGLVAENAQAFYGQVRKDIVHSYNYELESEDFLDKEGVENLIVNRRKTKAMIGAEFEVNQAMNDFLDKFKSIHLVGNQDFDEIKDLIDMLSLPNKSKEVSITNIHPDFIEKYNKKINAVMSYLPKSNALRVAGFHQYIYNHVTNSDSPLRTF